ncbi:RNA-directed DNA polymerase from mobile element jockey [Trichonephila clavipes]|nr:RNA-directed DNA polymerase from mobile element jockey [Trichonephila clavipes]
MTSMSRTFPQSAPINAQTPISEIYAPKFATEIGYGDFGKDLETLLLKNELRTISSEIASDIRHLSRARWEKTIKELYPETGTLWRHTSFLKKPFHHIPLKGALGSIAVAPIENAEVIADSLQKQFELNTYVENPRFSAHIQRKVQRFLDSPTCMDLEKTSPSEIQGFIKNLKPNKSSGIDLITNRIFKNLPTKFIIFIALLFNMLLENCYFPKSWRMAIV